MRSEAEYASRTKEKATRRAAKKRQMARERTLRDQAAVNSKEQVATSPSMNEQQMNAIMDLMAAHQSMSKPALNLEILRARILAMLLGPGALWEALRGKGPGSGQAAPPSA